MEISHAGRPRRLRMATQRSRTSSMSGSAGSSSAGDRDAHRARAGVGHEIEAAPALQRIGQHDVEQVRRFVDHHLADPRRHHEERLERLDRQRLDHERRHVSGDAGLARRASGCRARHGRRRRHCDPGGEPARERCAAASLRSRIAVCAPALDVGVDRLRQPPARRLTSSASASSPTPSNRRASDSLLITAIVPVDGRQSNRHGRGAPGRLNRCDVGT